ncbi:4-alpha-glucanotransferase [Nocardiopsis sp. MG754419]|uniref:4-alpha-glucanotransferase n=1 Tax=Nocardiopsis sp. MG754419 TaxID=2259865 RepID=UPI001BA5E5E0|nr:4-alpha-glucanotransferase [Nocardiopsis sp. MG754419]MBR8740218.1 4-alpha-glucanotransferase [Nocardiopsis sp. MG754419]
MRDVQLARVAEQYGIATTYEDWRGRRVPVGLDTIRHVLAALGVDPSDPEPGPRRGPLPPAVVVREGKAPDLALPRGSHSTVETADGALLPFDPGLPLGVHTLRVTENGDEHVAPLLVVPDRIEPTALREHHRLWGLMTQVYSVRSRASWGTGDLRDLAELADWSARDLGAEFTLINPVHATEPVAPVEPSPYLPVSRRYASPLYVRIEDVPEYARLDPAQRETIQRLARPLRERGRTADLLDRDAVWEAKRAALEVLFQVARAPGREMALRRYLESEGQPLVEFATWSALAEEYGPDHRTWPAHLRDVDALAVGQEALRRWPRVEFHRWLQWILDEQLAHAQEGARNGGMNVGIVHDLAIGVQAGGADAWMYRDALVQGLHVGAPPDEFNRRGQDWGQPPWHPTVLARQGYGPLHQILTHSLRHAGGLRMDHVMGLFRLWCVPEGASADQGTYLRYDHEGMVGVLALAARRADAVIIGEDLGTVEPWVREHLSDRGVLGTSVLWFENDREGRPRTPDQWRTDCLATVATHDLPPVASFLSAEHVELRDRLGLLDRPVDEERADSEHRVGLWRDVLVELGFLDVDVDPVTDPAAVVAAMHAYLEATPSRMLGVALADVVGERRMQNQPGTSTEYPNWRIPLTSSEGEPVLVDELLADPRMVGRIRRSLGPLAGPGRGFGRGL